MIKHIAFPLAIVLLGISQHSLADHPNIGVQGSLAGPIITTSAQTLQAGQIVYSLDFQYLEFDAVSKHRLEQATEQGEDVHSADSLTRTAFNFSYGWSDRLTLGLSLPYIKRTGLKTSLHEHEDEGDHHEDEPAEEDHHDEHEEPGFARLGDASGLGDARFFASYALWSESASQGSLLLGVKAPTGSTNERGDTGERLETELQPGSGSWDTIIGLAYSRLLGEWSVDANLLYTNATEGSQDTSLGDVFNYNLSLSRPIFAHKKHSHQHSSADHQDINLALVLELNGEWRDRIDVGGHTEDNSGGQVVYFSPGINAAIGNWSLSATIGIPYTDLHGTQSEPEARLLLKLGRSL